MSWVSKKSDICVCVFFAAEWIFSRLANLFRPFIFFIHTYGYCASAGEGFIEFGGQDVENEQREVS